MSDQRELTEQIFEAALELAPGDRSAFLDEQCGRDNSVRRRVEALLLADEQAGSFLRNPPLDLREQETHPELPDDATAFPIGFDPPKRQPPVGRLATGMVLEDRFSIIRFIAKGGMGEVYEAEDRYLQGVHVALKTILPHIADDPASEDSFKREVLLAREVAHPNLCPIYDVFYCKEPPPGSLFLSMKLLPGKTLGARLKEPVPIPPDEALAILKQMAAGLTAIHEAGIVHRDIKSNNVMFDGHGRDIRLWITDFGLARTQDIETTFTGRIGIAGTPAYMAPELFSGKPPSQATDLYAFGVVMHEVFTGSKPSMSSDGLAVTFSPRLSSASVPAFVVQLVKSCLDANPRRRVDAFKEATQTLALERSKTTTWTRRRFVGTAAAALCVTIGGTSWQWDHLDNLFHPLPRKRFIALLSWPAGASAQIMPMLTGALGAIKAELTRFEAFDRNLLVISPEDLNPDDPKQDAANAKHLADVCDSLGANLVLAISCREQAKDIHVSLRLLDPLTNQPLRTKNVACARSQITTLPERAALAASSLLSLESLFGQHEKTMPGTRSNEAFTAYQSAEALMKEPNEKGRDAAIEKYKEALDLDPAYAQAHARLAIAYVRLYDTQRDPAALDLARRNGEAAVTLNPALDEGHMALSAVAGDSGDQQAALDELAKASKLNPANYRALLWKAQVYYRLNRWADAEATLSLLLKQRPNYWLAYNELAYTFHQQGKYQQALDNFREASLAAPKSAMALGNVGAAYLQVGRFDEALDCLRKSAAISPNWDVVAGNISAALRAKGKYQEALPYAQKAASLNPSDDYNWMELGECYSSLPAGQKDALDAYLRAAQVAESNLGTDATDGMTWMRLALYKAKTGHRADAYTLIQKADSLGAGDIDSQLFKARTLELIGRRDQALEQLTVCFQRGANPFDVSQYSDLRSLRSDPRYQQLERSAAQAASDRRRT